MKFSRLVFILAGIAWAITGCNAVLVNTGASDTRTVKKLTSEPLVVISISDQMLLFYDPVLGGTSYRISTSLAGSGERTDSGRTPRGLHKVSALIGADAPLGAVFDSLLPTGEIVVEKPTNRAPVTTRVIRLVGLEERNKNTFDRLIYIHGSPHEDTLGKPASGGCARMAAAEVIDLFSKLSVDTAVYIHDEALEKAVELVVNQKATLINRREAALAGNERAIHSMCEGSFEGRFGVPQSHLDAFDWCKRGYEFRNERSALYYARLLETLPAPQKNLELAHAIYLSAAKQNNAAAAMKVAEGYKFGWGGTANGWLAMLYLNLARTLGG